MSEHAALESARLELLQRLDSGRTKAERNRSGQFATPPELAEEVVACALSLLPEHAKIRFLDPGFGTGPFYSALLRQAAKARIETAVGYEVDRYYGEPVMQLWKETPLALEIGDFTTAEPPAADAG
jgi:hypothetical protein